MATLDSIIDFEDCTTTDLNKAKTWTSREAARKAVSRTFRRDIVNPAPRVWAIRSTHWTGNEVVWGYLTANSEVFRKDNE